MDERIVLVELGSFGSNIYIKDDHNKKATKKSFLNFLDLLNSDNTIDTAVFTRLVYQIVNHLEFNNIDIADANFIATGIYRTATNKGAVEKVLAKAGAIQIILISQKQELEYSFSPFFKHIQSHETYSNVKCFDIGGGSIEFGQYKGSILNYIDSVPFGVFHGVKTLFYTNESKQLNLQDAFKRLHMLVCHELDKLMRTIDNTDFNSKCIIGGSTAKNIKKKYFENSFLSLDNLQEYIKSEKDKLFDSYKNIKHLERFFKTKQATRKQLRTLIGCIIIEQLLIKYEVLHFEVNEYSLLEGVLALDK